MALLAVKDDGQPYSWIGKSLADDKELALAAIENYGASMKASGDLIRDDKDIMLKAVENIGWNLKYASDRLKDDKDIVIIAVKRDGSALQYASDRLKNDIDVANAMLESNYKYFMYFGETIKNNKTFIFKLKDKSIHLLEEFLRYLGNDLKNDEEFIYDLTLINHQYLKYASEKLLNNKNFISKILKIDEKCILLAGKLILSNFDFIESNVHNKDLLEECKLMNILNQIDIRSILKDILLDNGFNTIGKIMKLDKNSFLSLKYSNENMFKELKLFQQKIKDGITLTNKFRPIKIVDLYDISIKTYKILDKNFCLKIKDLLNREESDILTMDGMNRTIYKEIIELQNRIREDIKNDLIEIL